MKVYVVMTDDCYENDCGCISESIDSIFLNEDDAKVMAARRYHGYVTPYELIEGEKIKITEEIKDRRYERDTESICCPKDHGYCERSENITKEEVILYQSCGRNYACCIEAFTCKICGTRYIVHLMSPEVNW